jgi:hypothetical protein
VALIAGRGDPLTMLYSDALPALTFHPYALLFSNSGLPMVI